MQQNLYPTAEVEAQHEKLVNELDEYTTVLETEARFAMIFCAASFVALFRTARQLRKTLRQEN